jgi:hypothetical protein
MDASQAVHLLHMVDSIGILLCVIIGLLGGIWFMLLVKR